MLSWSAETIGLPVRIERLVGDGDVGVAGGPELVVLGRASVRRDPDPGPAAAVASVLGEEAAVAACAVAAAFELLNRAVDAVGLPVGRAARERAAGTIAALGMESFPHATM